MSLVDCYSYICFWPWAIEAEVTALGQAPAAPCAPQMPNVGQASVGEKKSQNLKCSGPALLYPWSLQPFLSNLPLVILEEN